MKFTNTYTTMWHDTDANRVMRTSKILMYLQETANIGCDKLGIPLDRLRDERGLGFILSQLSMKILRPIHSFENIEVSTWCREAKGYSFYRYFDIKINGKPCVFASSIWALVDINSRSLVKCDESMVPHFPYDEPVSADRLPPRARVSRNDVLEYVGDRRIYYSDIDYNMHMNNTNYPDMLCDFLPDMNGKYVSEMSLSYLKEAPLGATLKINRGLREDGYFVFKTENASSDICLEAIVKLKDI